MVLPAIGIKALGWVYVCGLSLAPAPATGMIAFINQGDFTLGSFALVRLPSSGREIREIPQNGQ